MGNSLGKKHTSEANERDSDSDSDDATKSPGDSENAVTPEEATNQDEPSPVPENPDQDGEPSTDHPQPEDSQQPSVPPEDDENDNASSESATFSLPKGWQKRCQQDPQWCVPLFQHAIDAHETEQLFEGNPRPHLNAAQKEKAQKGCATGIQGDDCRTLGLLRQQVQVYLSKRDGALGLDGKGLSTGVWAGVVGGVLLLVGAIILFFVGCGGGKEKGKKGASRSKSSKLKSKSSKLKSKIGKSKGGKSRVSKISSRKSRKSGKAVRSKSGKTGKGKK